MANELDLKLSKQEFWAAMRRDLVSWQMLVCFGLILTGPLWYSLLTTFFLWTFLYDPNSIFVYSILLADIVFFLFCWDRFFRNAVRRSKGMKELRKAALAGDEEAKEKYLDRRKQLKTSPNPAHLLVATFVAIHLLIPIGVSLIIYNATPDGTYAIRDHGKLRASTRKEGVQIVLNRLHKKGLFWFVD